MEAENTKFKLGSEELNTELESKYMKFTKGIPQNIEVELDQEVEKRINEFEENGQKRLVARYDLNIVVDGHKKLWSVSSRVLTTINTHIAQTQKFKVILRESAYEVIPLGLKE